MNNGISFTIKLIGFNCLTHVPGAFITFTVKNRMVSKYHFRNHAPAKFTELEQATVLSNKDLRLVHGKMARNWLFPLEG